MGIVEKTAPVVIDLGSQDIFCSGISRIEKLAGGNFRFVVYAEHTCDGHTEHHIILNMIWHSSALPAAISATCAAAGNFAGYADVGGFHLLM